MTTKICTKCGNEKPLSEFGKHRLSKDGHAYRCKECARKHSKAWSLTPAGIFTRVQARANYYKKHDPKRYRPLEITRDGFVEWYNSQPKTCVYCDIPEETIPIVAVSFDRRVAHLVIDRKDNDLGYNKENMVLSCHLCNFIKMNRFSHYEMREIAQKYIKTKWMEFIER